MKHKDSLAKLLQVFYAQDKAETTMPTLKATRLLEDMKKLIEKYSAKE